MEFYQSYKAKYHFSLNFYSLFLLITFIPDFIGLPASLFTNGIWLIRAVMGFWLIHKFKKKIFILNWGEKLFLFVTFVYFLNIAIDVFLQNYPIDLGSPIDLIGFFLCVLVAFSFRYEDSFSTKSSYYFFLFTLALGLLIAFFVAIPSPPPLIGRFDANSTVNTINYGKMGCSMAIVAIYGYKNYKFKFSLLIYPLLVLLGIVSIMRSGSRSPVVVLLLVVVFYVLSDYSFLKGLFIVFCSFLILWFSIGVIIQLSEMIESDIVTRLLASIESGDSSGRDGIYLNVLGKIKDSPIFGSFYLISSGIGKGSYPHNYFLEVFMTTGLIGGIPFIVMALLSLIKCFQLLRYKHAAGWIILLFLQSFFYGMFSSNLFSAEDFWGLCFLVLSIDLITARNNFKVNNKVKII
ncbi:O-antigen ligase family protein [Maribacter sp. BPC-D8]|uniref:O-antigen ligase family protein n=1 Tax=Maribacter sp. BPC-D8 TaxID=3053613 RepID=UPI002B477721|nr:O-antigen ligase family protein [Maribacter sp. BPC-D8]WRI28347.1 O-antigen ligase family protein [Maribacter sp. BPC-D8]